MTEDTQYAYVRFKKLKTKGHVVAAAEHHTRVRHTPNADKTKSKDNWLLAGSDNPAQDVQDRLDDMGIKVRHDNVLALDLLVLVSPEWFEPDPYNENLLMNMWDADKVHLYAKRALAWSREYFGSDNVVAARVHLDETTPHFTALVTPIDDTPRQKGPTVRLNSKRWTGNTKKLSAMQDSWHQYMQDQGLERGIRGSKATHTPVNKFYYAITKPIPEPPNIKIDTPPVFKREDWANKLEHEINQKIKKDWKILAMQASTASHDRKKTRQYKKTATSLQNKTERIANENSKLKSRLSYISLIKVADTLGLHFNDEYWINIDCSITIDDNKFFDHHQKKGGFGSISLVMHVLRCEFYQAIKFLGDRFGRDNAVKAVAQMAGDIADTAIKQTADFEPLLPPQPEDFEEAEEIEDAAKAPGIGDSEGEKEDDDEHEGPGM